MERQDQEAAEAILGYSFTDSQLLATALTHASLADHRLLSNERMEFLGDAVLGMVVCEYLYNNYSDLLEGEMTKIKSSVVSRRTCAEVAGEMGLGELLRLGKGMGSHEDLPSSVVAAVYESIIGAVYIDGGLDAASDVILKLLGPRIEHAARSGHQFNFKSVLQQTAQQQRLDPPTYVVLDEKGPDHAKCFEVCVEMAGRRYPSCWGSSKKQAEQEAALEALLEMNLAYETKGGEIRLREDEADRDDQPAESAR